MITFQQCQYTQIHDHDGFDFLLGTGQIRLPNVIHDFLFNPKLSLNLVKVQCTGVAWLA